MPRTRPPVVLGAVLAVAAVLAGQALAGGFATVQLSSTPTDARAGDPWRVDLTVLQHGLTPLDGLSPAITIANGGEEHTVAATPTGRTGVYHADVVFPTSGTWTWRIWDGFSQTHTYAPVTIGAGSGSAASASDGLDTWLAALAGVAAVAVGGAVVALTSRRRSRPAPA